MLLTCILLLLVTYLIYICISNTIKIIDRIIDNIKYKRFKNNLYSGNTFVFYSDLVNIDNPYIDNKPYIHTIKSVSRDKEFVLLDDGTSYETEYLFINAEFKY